MKQPNKTIVLTAGGTGGHIYPAEALAVELQRRGFNVMFYTDERGLGNYQGILSQLETKTISSGSVIGKDIKTKILSLIKVGFGVIQAMINLTVKRPRAVVGFGGYASFPTAVAAIVLRIPLIIHEQNSVMSRTNRLLAPFARWCAQSFNHVKNTPQSAKTFLCGMPVRETIVALHTEPHQPWNPKQKFNLLILGGSQGAKIFGEVVPQALALLDDEYKKQLYVYQQCRQDDVEMVKSAYQKLNIEASVSHFFNNMPELYKKSHLMISRSGASSIYEITAVGIPAILVPLPTAADNHQYYNAKELADAQGAILIEQKDFTAEKLATAIKELLNSDDTYKNISENAKRHSIIDAQVRLATKIEAIKG